jgi:5-methylcytosine-specific restriction endonuclease McrA
MKTGRLLYLQGDLCFYCRRKLDLSNATIEHVIPKSMGGKGDESNVVVCCRAINNLFANMTPKQKIEALLAWHGRMPCPESSAGLGRN